MRLIYSQQPKWRIAGQYSSIILAILVGGVAGSLAITANQAPAKWSLIIVLVSALPAAILIINDLKKLILAAFVVDIPLGLDIAIPDLEWHQGGPNGYMISLMTLGLGVGYAVWILERKPKARFFPQTTVPILLYMLMVMFSFYQARNVQLSAFELFLLGQFFLMYFYIANHVTAWRDIRFVVGVVIVSMLFESALMVIQYVTGFSFSLGPIASRSYEVGASAGAIGLRVGGTIGQPNAAGTYLTVVLLIAISALLIDSLLDKTLVVIACVLGSMALIFTSSRTAWGGFVLGLLLLLMQTIQTSAGRKLILGTTVGMLLVGMFFGAQIMSRIETSAADRTRQELATMALNIIDDFPLGIGANNYDQVMSDKYAHPNWVGHTHMPVHNKLLLVWSETGPQGLVAFVLVLAATTWQGARWITAMHSNPQLAVVMACFFSAFISYVFHMQTEGFATRVNLQSLWFIIAMIAAMNRLMLDTEPVTEHGRVPAVTPGDF